LQKLDACLEDMKAWPKTNDDMQRSDGGLSRKNTKVNPQKMKDGLDEVEAIVDVRRKVAEN
jgi:hypothetical protein